MIRYHHRNVVYFHLVWTVVKVHDVERIPNSTVETRYFF